MPLSPERRSLLQAAVVGLAVLLAGVIAFHGLRRGAARMAPPLPGSAQGSGVLSDGGSATESVVEDLPPVRFSRMGRARARNVNVPPPSR
jgi:hypothetical protein